MKKIFSRALVALAFVGLVGSVQVMAKKQKPSIPPKPGQNKPAVPVKPQSVVDDFKARQSSEVRDPLKDDPRSFPAPVFKKDTTSPFVDPSTLPAPVVGRGATWSRAKPLSTRGGDSPRIGRDRTQEDSTWSRTTPLSTRGTDSPRIGSQRKVRDIPAVEESKPAKKKSQNLFEEVAGGDAGKAKSLVKSTPKEKPSKKEQARKSLGIDTDINNLTSKQLKEKFTERVDSEQKKITENAFQKFQDGEFKTREEATKQAEKEFKEKYDELKKQRNVLRNEVDKNTRRKRVKSFLSGLFDALAELDF